jgi:cyclase
LTRTIAAAVPIPVIAAGGAGCVAHVSDVVARGAADAVCVASLVHYHYARQTPFDASSFQREGNVEHLRRRGGFTRIEDAALPDIKEHLLAHGIGCRWPVAPSLAGAERA